MHDNKLEVPYECESDDNEDGEVNNQCLVRAMSRIVVKKSCSEQAMTCLVRVMSRIVVKKSYSAQAMTCLDRAMSRIVEKINNLQHIYGRDVTNLDNGNLFVPELDPIPKLANSKVAVTFQSVSFKRLFSKKSRSEASMYILGYPGIPIKLCSKLSEIISYLP